MVTMNQNYSIVSKIFSKSLSSVLTGIESARMWLMGGREREVSRFMSAIVSVTTLSCLRSMWSKLLTYFAAASSVELGTGKQKPSQQSLSAMVCSAQCPGCSSS